MKKFKVFLLLSILLCFGFILSPEVHAQSNGPKAFEEGDILPAGKIKISWDFSEKYIADDDYFFIYGTNDFSITIEQMGGLGLSIYGVEDSYTSLIGDVIITLDNDVTITSLTSDGKDYYEYIDGALFWEVVPTGPKIFEEGDELPAGYIKISWDFTGKPIAENAIFYISGDYLQIEIWENNNIEIYINDKVFYGDISGEIVLFLSESSTIYSIGASDDYDYYEYIDDALLWEVVTEEDFIYSEGYQEGYSDGYFLGYKHAREIYGYYDSTTDEWLSVSEYLDLYGTDKLGQNDFYNNFDKYFIPAMIIVFGGAIVLTILKVFKGRE